MKSYNRDLAACRTYIAIICNTCTAISVDGLIAALHHSCHTDTINTFGIVCAKNFTK